MNKGGHGGLLMPNSMNDARIPSLRETNYLEDKFTSLACIGSILSILGSIGSIGSIGYIGSIGSGRLYRPVAGLCSEGFGFRFLVIQNECPEGTSYPRGSGGMLPRKIVES